jgi:hypothetical protein
MSLLDSTRHLRPSPISLPPLPPTFFLEGLESKAALALSLRPDASLRSQGSRSVPRRSGNWTQKPSSRQTVGKHYSGPDTILVRQAALESKEWRSATATATVPCTGRHSTGYLHLVNLVPIGHALPPRAGTLFISGRPFAASHAERHGKTDCFFSLVLQSGLAGTSPLPAHPTVLQKYVILHPALVRCRPANKPTLTLFGCSAARSNSIQRNPRPSHPGLGAARRKTS